MHDCNATAMICINTVGSFSCQCNASAHYYGNGQTCYPHRKSYSFILLFICVSTFFHIIVIERIVSNNLLIGWVENQSSKTSYTRAIYPWQVAFGQCSCDHVYERQVFLTNFALTGLICWCERANKFSLTSIHCSQRYNDTADDNKQTRGAIFAITVSYHKNDTPVLMQFLNFLDKKPA